MGKVVEEKTMLISENDLVKCFRQLENNGRKGRVRNIKIKYKLALNNVGKCKSLIEML